MADKYCTACGGELTSGAKFCPSCGARVAPSAGEPGKKAARKAQKNTWRRDIVIIGAVLAVAAVGYFAFRSDARPPQPPQQTQMPGHPDVPGAPMGGTMAGLENLPTDFNGLVQMGNQTMDAGNYPVAAECYRRALAISPTDVNVRTDFGACLHGMGLEERALQEFQTVIRQDPSHAIANFNIGIVFYGMEKPDSARYYWEKYLQVDPNGSASGQARELLKSLKG